MIGDAHIDTLSELMRRELPFGQRNNKTHVDLPRILQAGVQLQVCALFTMPDVSRSVQLLQILKQVAFAQQQFQLNKDKVVHAVRRGQVQNLEPGKLTVLLSIEGGGALAGDLDILDIFFRLGVRGLTLTWNHRNELADGVGDPLAKGGLTGFGQSVVKRLEELGMAVDVSHLSEAGFWDVMQTAQGPVIASHSNAKALCGHPRNLTDAQLQAIGERAGFVGLNFLPAFLDDGGSASIEHIVRHAVHIAGIAGVETIGFGSDFDGIGSVPAGVNDVLSFQQVVDALAQEFSPQEMELIQGKNLQRVLASVLPE